ncbi:MAG: hypothetical protein ACUBOA_12850 [Candidatus Loosdrechtia sp.]|uniref:hypothetical protein n=1 Tax=Candidatus Loosdrechtia sp. TaxID=3101272 RepID=UPI003A6133C5|nr:MAG: hypothetical protein QY305_12240 [Candidatus Jettenia sp. AMX2]
MSIRYTKWFAFGTLLVSSSMFTFFSTSLITEKSTQAQHTDIFGRLDGKKDSFHQSFAPYEGIIPIPWIDEKPTPTTIKVTEVITYEIPVDEKKLVEKKLTSDDLELKEVTNASEINFHQVDCYFFEVVKQTQIRTVENLSFIRDREGTQYWLSDGKKYVEWGRWSDWDVEKGSQQTVEMAEKKP